MSHVFKKFQKLNVDELVKKDKNKNKNKKQYTNLTI